VRGLLGIPAVGSVAGGGAVWAVELLDESSALFA
jgi:hypothetical protein